MKKKITIITSFFDSPFHENRAPYNDQLFLNLKSYYDINIIRPIAWTDIYKSKPNVRKKSYYKTLWKSIPVRYPTYYFIPRISVRTNGIFYFFSFLRAFATFRRIPDLFYTTWAYPDAYATSLLAKIFKRPYVVRVHGSDINDLAYRKELQGKVRYVLENASGIISPSKALEQKIISLGIDPSKILTMYSGVDKKKFYPEDKDICINRLGLEPGKKRILYIGNLKEAKGVLDLVSAIEILRRDIQNVELLIIGKGEDRGKIETLIKKDNLEHQIRLVGAVDHKDLRGWINAVDCVALPSYSEGVPNVLLEAMACSRNIVATNVGGIPEIVKHPDTYLVNPGDIDALVSKLRSALSDAAYETIPSFSIQTYEDISLKVHELMTNIL